ncbi:MAG: tetratricopeptide repeat protein [Pseudomonadota bacterium]
MPRFYLALLALPPLAACATMGHSAANPGQSAATAQQANGDQQQTAQTTRSASHAQRQAAGRPTRIDRAARAEIEHEDMLSQMTFWAQEYTNFPNDLEAAQKFSESLRKGGRNDRAAQVALEGLQRHDGDPQLLMTYGLALIAGNKAQDALQPLALVAHADQHDWRSRSALGVALDQLGRFDEARQAYQEALAIKPDDPGVLTNLGVSHLLAGEPQAAEPILRQAVALPGASPEARQNLAIAVALQGRFDEAESLERIDLPPQVVAENMAYLRSLLNDPHSWSDMRHATAQ